MGGGYLTRKTPLNTPLNETIFKTKQKQKSSDQV